MFARFRPRGRKLCASVWCKRFARAYTAEATRLFGVVRGKVNGWMRLWEREGKSEAEGPASRTVARGGIKRGQGQRLPSALWTREAVRQLPARESKARFVSRIPRLEN